MLPIHLPDTGLPPPLHLSAAAAFPRLRTDEAPDSKGCLAFRTCSSCGLVRAGRPHLLRLLLELQDGPVEDVVPLVACGQTRGIQSEFIHFEEPLVVGESS